MSEAAYDKLPAGLVREFGAGLERRDVALSVSTKLAESMVVEMVTMFEKICPGFLRQDLSRAGENFVRSARLFVYEKGELVYEVHDVADSCFVVLFGEMNSRCFGFDGFGTEEKNHLHRLETVRAKEKLVLLRMPKEFFVRYSVLGKECLTRQKLDWIETQSGLFVDWEPEKQYALATAMRWQSLDKGRYLTQAGDRVDGLWFVVSGELAVGTALYDDLFATQQARTVDLALLSANDIFGICEAFEKAVLFRKSANAQHDTRLLFLKTENLNEFLFGDAKTKTILQSLVSSRKKWDEIMVSQAIDNDSVYVAISHASMKLAKYSLADFVAPPTRPSQPKPTRSRARPSRDDLREGDGDHQSQARRRRSSTKRVDHEGVQTKEQEGNPHRRRSSLSSISSGPRRRSSNAILQDLSHFDPGEEKILLTEDVSSKEQLSKMMERLESAIEAGEKDKEEEQQTVVIAPIVEEETPTKKEEEDTRNEGTKWLSRFDNMSVKVLVVDDSKTTLNVLKWKFKKQGCEVSTATNGIEALELMKENLYTLVVSDVMMPGMDGVTAVKTLREWEGANRPNDRQPVLLLTRIEESPVELKESEMQGVGYSHKSETVKDVKKLVMRCFGCEEREDWLSRFSDDYTVLLVDDSKTTLNILQWKFKKKGCQVVTASNGLEALETMKKQLFAIVVSDIMMPEMDGVTAVKNLRVWESIHRPDDIQPVLLLTRIEESPVEIKQSEMRNVGFRHKSETLDDLHPLVQTCLTPLP